MTGLQQTGQAPRRGRRKDAPALVLMLVALVALALLTWQLSHLLMLVFGAILIGVMLSWAAEVIRRWTGIGGKLSLLLAVAAILALAAGFVFFLGAQIKSELAGLLGQAPQLFDALEKTTGISNLESLIEKGGSQLIGQGSLLGDLTGISAGLVSAAVNVLLVFSGAVYFAAQPEIYRDGFLALVPSAARRPIADLLSELKRVLRHWFLGQLASMLLIGILTTLGLFLLGIPSAVALGFLAGLLEFVPYVGPVLSAIPAIAVGMTQDGSTALWVLALYVVVQQAEAILITPIIQNQAVNLPPALIIFSVLGFGVLLGPIGIVLGTPLTVVLVTVLKHLADRSAGSDQVGRSDPP